MSFDKPMFAQNNELCTNNKRNCVKSSFNQTLSMNLQPSTDNHKIPIFLKKLCGNLYFPQMTFNELMVN